MPELRGETFYEDGEEKLTVSIDDKMRLTDAPRFYLPDYQKLFAALPLGFEERPKYIKVEWASALDVESFKTTGAPMPIARAVTTIPNVLEAIQLSEDEVLCAVTIGADWKLLFGAMPVSL